MTKVYNDEKLHIRVYHEFIKYEDTLCLYNFIIQNAKFKNTYLTKKGEVSKKRNKCMYGSIPHYRVSYRGQEMLENVIDWNEMPYLRDLSQLLTSFTGQIYHVCVIQLYNNGEVGILPHRDKEMKMGTIITSLSLGTNRIMRFELNGKVIDIPLNNGTLCLIDPPTNDYWSHSILKDNSNTSRMSLIFRNCEGMF